MRVTARFSPWLLPLVLVIGCAHKPEPAQTQALAPPIEEKPLPAPSNAPKNLPPPIVGEVKSEPAPQPALPAAEPPKPVHHPRKPAPVQEAANGPAPSVSAIGQLSQGASRDRHSEISDAILAIEKRLTAITRPLSDAEQKTAAQIREFLKQARVALNSSDVDGAHTLTDKARILLAELDH